MDNAPRVIRFLLEHGHVMEITLGRVNAEEFVKGFANRPDWIWGVDISGRHYNFEKRRVQGMFIYDPEEIKKQQEEAAAKQLLLQQQMAAAQQTRPQQPMTGLFSRS